jgi:hypothetical protein
VIILQLDKLTSTELGELSTAIHKELHRRFVPIPLIDDEKKIAVGSHVYAIKALQKRTGCSLVNAKWSVDAWLDWAKEHPEIVRNS